MQEARILAEVAEGRRMTFEEAVFLLQKGDFLALGKAADARARRLHPDGIVTFVIDRNINYTNICQSRCRFCAFYREKEAPDAYVLTKEEVFKKIEETLALDGTQVMLQGGLNPDLGLNYYTDLLRSIRSRFPQVYLHSFSPPEIWHMVRQSGLSLREVLQELKQAGLKSIPGGGAEILVDEVRQQVSPHKISAGQWLAVMREAHLTGMQTTATMMIGAGESIEQRVQHMEVLRSLQDETGGFRAFIMWTFQPGNTKLRGRHTWAYEYLKTLAVARLFMDNFTHLQGSWVTQGKEVGQLTLSFGANDLGSIMIEENVVRSTGVSYAMSKEEMIRLIAEAGKIPAQRDTEYNVLRVFR